MVIEDNEIPSGWPLGLGSMSMRFRLVEISPPAAAAQPNSLHRPSSSFSSFSTSTLDTVSTASFFQDRSVSLGRLLGVKPGSRNRIANSSTIHIERHNSNSRLCSRDHGTRSSRGHCVPLIHNAIEKLSRSKSCSRQ